MVLVAKGRWGKYSLKENPKRFFTPIEWTKFFNELHPRNKFHFLFLFSTGMRYNEAKQVVVGDIDFGRKWIVVKKAKGGRGKIRYSHFSTNFIKHLRYHISFNNLKNVDVLGFPTIQGMNKILKRTCKKIGIKDYKDFSIHNIRKTHENYLLALGKHHFHISNHMGHTIDIASGHYISGALIKGDVEKNKIKKWFGDMFE